MSKVADLLRQNSTSNGISSDGQILQLTPSLMLLTVGILVAIVMPTTITNMRSKLGGNLPPATSAPLSEVVEVPNLQANLQPISRLAEPKRNNENIAGTMSILGGSDAASSSMRVTVNGEAIPVPPNGVIHRTFEDNDTSMQVNISSSNKSSNATSHTSIHMESYSKSEAKSENSE